MITPINSNVHSMYNAWRTMLSRCDNPKHNRYHLYGGRGIKVCRRWRKFENFLVDMGERPTGTSIDRADNNKGYCKSNCRWSTPTQQARNRKTNRRIQTPQGEMLLAEAAEISGIRVETLFRRLKHKWPTARLFDPPVSHPTRYINTPMGRMRLCEAAARSGLSKQVLRMRVKYKWPVAKLFSPTQTRS